MPRTDRSWDRHFNNRSYEVNTEKFIISGCPRRRAQSVLLVQNVSNSPLVAENLPPSKSPFFTVVSLTDCANVYSAVTSIQTRCACEITKINPPIRDSSPHGVLSLIDAGANASDVGEKPNGNTKLFLHLRNSGQISISFLGRKG